MDTVTQPTIQEILGTSLIMQGLRGFLNPCKTTMALQWEHIIQTESINMLACTKVVESQCQILNDEKVFVWLFFVCIFLTLMPQ